MRITYYTSKHMDTAVNECNVSSAMTFCNRCQRSFRQAGDESFSRDFFPLLTTLHKCTPISINNGFRIFFIYNLENGIKLETIPNANTENSDFKYGDYPSIYIALFLTVRVFGCDVTGVPCEGVLHECDHY